MSVVSDEAETVRVPEWVVRDVMGGKAVMVSGWSVDEAIEAGVAALIEDFPELLTCRECEREAVLVIDVYAVTATATRYESRTTWHRSDWGTREHEREQELET